MMKKLLCTLLFAVFSIVSLEAQVIVSGGTPLTIINSGNTPSTVDNTDFGSVSTSDTQTYIYTVENTNAFPVVLILDNLGDQVNFEQSASFPSPLPGNSTTTFSVTFKPQSTGLKTSTVNLQILNGGGPPPINFSFNISGTGTTPPPSSIIRVFGNETVSIPNFASAGSATEANGRGYGDVAVGNSTTKSFKVTNDPSATSNLTINAISEFGDDFAIDPFSLPSLPIVLTPGDEFDFDVVYSPSAVASDQSFVSITYDGGTFFGFNVTGNGVTPEPEMDMLDNANAPLASGGSVDFGSQDISVGNETFTFTIQNNGTDVLNLTGANPYVEITGANASDFTLGTIPSSTIAASDDTTFTITFNPSAFGTRTATVSIANDDANEDPYTFSLTGEGIDANVDNPLLITQYYENGSNDVIEIKNVSTSTVSPLFFVCVYEDLNTTTGVIGSNAPDQSVAINTPLNPGEVITINSLSFTGNDVVLISTSAGTDCYDSRLDIMGVVGSSTPPVWGANTSFIKGCGTNEVPSLNFAYDAATNTVTDYIELATTEVDGAASNTNLFLGTQTVGPTSYGSSWSNGLPDKTKNAVIIGTYNGSSGFFDACDLTISASGNLNFAGSTTNYVKVYNDLFINGNFILGDQAALVTVNESATITGSITKQESTTTLNNSFDFTYWSSPVQNASTNVFTDTGAPANRIFEWRKPSTGDYGAWESKTGTLENARGYISEAPDGSTQHSIEFSGVPNNGIVSINVGLDNTVADGAGGFNLVGNPYPCAVDAVKFIELSDNEEIDNGAFSGSLWFWTHSTAYQDNPGEDADYTSDDYRVFNLSGGSSPGVTNRIGSSQGFFVNAKTSGAIFFTNEMKLDGLNTQFFKPNDNKKIKTTEERDRMWLNITSNVGGAFSEILVGFFDKATDGEDRGYDGLKFGGGYINLYSTIGEKKYSIQGLSSFSSDKKVNIGFDSYIKETLKISINTLEGVLKNEEIYLVDNYLNIVHDLKASDYEFEVTETGSFADRFTLQFNKTVLSVGEELTDSDFIVANENEVFRIRASKNVENIKVYDMLGKLLIDTNPKQLDFILDTSSIAKGTVLIMNATLENGAEISKKAIKY